MDRICRILWPYLWCGLLLCVLSVASQSEAATRKNVSMPSAQTVASSSGVPIKSGASLSIPGAPQQEYIPHEPGNRKLPLKVLPRVDYSIPRTINAAKNVLRVNPAAIMGSAVLAGLLAGVDALLDEDGVPKKEKKVTDYEPAPNEFYWRFSSPGPGNPTHPTGFSSPSASAGCTKYAQYFAASYPDVNSGGGTITSITSGGLNANCRFSWSGASSGTGDIAAQRLGTQCPPGFTLATDGASCYSVQLVPLSDADFDLMDAFASAQSSDWLKDLLNDACNGSPSPGACYESLKDNVSLSGPSSVAGPSTSTTSTYTKPDGTIGTGSANTTTNYNITYGPTYYDYSKTQTTTTTKDGVPVSEETVTESPAVDSEVPAEEPQEEEQEEPSPCASDCDGPVYEDLYTPTEDVKEDFLSDYMTRVSSLPILDAVAGMFTVSVGGSCPVWEYHGSMAVMGAVMPIDLTFDFFCLSWVVALKPWLQVIFALIGSYMAIRVALL